jgi:hypothetical protein
MSDDQLVDYWPDVSNVVESEQISKKWLQLLSDREVADRRLQLKNIADCSKESRIRWIKGCEIKKQTATKKDDQYDNELMDESEKLELQELIEKRPKEWFLHRHTIERFMAESLGTRAKGWNGKLQAKNVWIWGETGCGKSRWAANQDPTIPTTMRKNFNKWCCGYNPCNRRGGERRQNAMQALSGLHRIPQHGNPLASEKNHQQRKTLAKSKRKPD